MKPTKHEQLMEIIETVNLSYRGSDQVRDVSMLYCFDPLTFDYEVTLLDVPTSILCELADMGYEMSVTGEGAVIDGMPTEQERAHAAIDAAVDDLERSGDMDDEGRAAFAGLHELVDADEFRGECG